MPIAWDSEALLEELRDHQLEEVPLPAEPWDRDYLDMSHEESAWDLFPAELDPDEPADLYELEVGLR